MRNDIGLDFILHKRQEGLCPSGELSSNDERQVMWNVISLVVVANWKFVSTESEKYRNQSLCSTLSFRRAAINPPVSLR